jgi:hypothetical protein
MADARRARRTGDGVGSFAVRHRNVVLFRNIQSRNEWLFRNIPRTTANIDKSVAKSTERDISRASVDAFSLESAVDVVMTRGNIAMVHAD